MGALEWEEEHWGGAWRAYDGGFVAAGVVPASGGRWLPVVANDVLDDTYGTLTEAQAEAQAAYDLLPPRKPARRRGPRRWVRNTGPDPGPHPADLTE